MVHHRCNICLKRAVLPRRDDLEMAPYTRYTLQRNAASTMKDLIRYFDNEYPVKNTSKKYFEVYNMCLLRIGPESAS